MFAILHSTYCYSIKEVVNTDPQMYFQFKEQKHQPISSGGGVLFHLNLVIPETSCCLKYINPLTSYNIIVQIRLQHSTGDIHVEL